MSKQLNITWIYPECDLNVTWMCSECDLNVNVPRMFLKLYFRPLACKILGKEMSNNVEALWQLWRSQVSTFDCSFQRWPFYDSWSHGCYTGMDIMGFKWCVCNITNGMGSHNVQICKLLITMCKISVFCLCQQYSTLEAWRLNRWFSCIVFCVEFNSTGIVYL